MEGKQLYIFDFDGTLGDTNSLIVRVMMATFDAVGISRPSVEACTATIGLPLARCFEVAAGVDAATAERCAEVYTRIFDAHLTPGAVQPFDGVVETLGKLRDEGRTLALATSRGHDSLDVILDDMGIEPFFDCIVAAGDVEKAKPAPDAVLAIMKKLAFKPSETVVVGDAPYDILMGRNAGVRTCGVSYGNGSREDMERAGADWLIDRFDEILLIG